jgi:DNA invertase Pin-like site-specific DNA recombinase
MSWSIEADVMSVGLEWVVWPLASAVAGFVAVLSAIAVGNAYRRRHCTLQARSPLAATRPPLRPTKPGPAADTMQLLDGAPTTSPVWAPGTASAASASRLPPDRALIGYVTIAADAGAGDVYESVTAIEAASERSGWTLLEVVREREESPALDRPGLRYALERITDGRAQGLVVSELARLSRSVVDLGALMARLRNARATLVALDLDIDTSTPKGHQVASTLIALNAREHERISRGTRRGVAKGHASGRPPVSHRRELVERIVAMRAANMTLRAITDHLNAEGVPTLRGGKEWRPSSIQAILGYRRPRPPDHLPPPHARARR